MAVLDADAVKSGRVVPQAGDFVNGFAYVSGNPTSNDSYRPLQGNDYLSSIPTDRANIARSVLTGRAPYPSIARNNKFNQQILQDVLSADPQYDAAAYKRRTDSLKDLTSGKTAGLIRALNQAPLHALSLADAYDELHNSDIPEWANNAATNVEAGLASVLPSGKKQLAARGKFNAVQPAFSGEAATLYKGGPATIPDIQAQEKAFRMGLGPTESSSALATAAQLFKDRLDTIDRQRENALGFLKDDPSLMRDFPTISPEARAALNNLYSRYYPGQDVPDPMTLATRRPANRATPSPQSLPHVAQPSQTKVLNGQTYVNINGQWYHQ